MPRQIRVLHYVPGFHHGGIESRLLDWMRNADRELVSFDVLIQTDGHSELLDEFRRSGGRVFRVSKFGPRTAARFIRELDALFAANPDFDAVHCHSLETSYFVLRAARRAGIERRILHSRTVRHNGRYSGTLRRYLKRLAVREATDYLACSEEAAKFMMAGVGANPDSSKVTVIPNGIEASIFRFDAAVRDETRRALGLGDRFVVCNVGRMTAAKNQSFVIEIFEQFCRQNDDAALLIIGDGPLRDELLRLAADRGIADRIQFLGVQPDIQTYLQASDAFVFPSLYEGFGTAAVEAQAAGLATYVSSAVPRSVAVTELVEFLDLTQSPRVWADRITDGRKRNTQRDTFEKIVSAGFDARDTARKLTEIYQVGIT